MLTAKQAGYQVQFFEASAPILKGKLSNKCDVNKYHHLKQRHETNHITEAHGSGIRVFIRPFFAAIMDNKNKL